METLWKDLIYGLRMLAKSPAVTAVAILSLALGIGANTAMFSWVQALLLQPLRAPEPERLVHLYSTNPSGFRASYSYLNYRDERDRNEVFSAMAARRPTPVSFGDGERSERIFAMLVSGDFWEMMDVEAALGRTFTAGEDEVPGRDAVAVISHAFWQRRFAGDPAIVGKSVTLNGRPFTILGVLPEGWRYATVSIDADVFAPLTMMGVLIPGADRLGNRGWGFLEVIARLKPGVSLEQAQAHMEVVAKELAEAYPNVNEDRTVLVIPESEALLPQEAQGAMVGLLALLMGVVAFVLLIACANVANLQMARAMGREREIGIRLALGAHRRRVLRQLLTESVLLSALAGIAGVGLAVVLNRLVQSIQPPVGVPVVFDIPLDTRVLGFTAVVTAAAGILFGFVPALRASHPSFLSSLQGESSGRITAKSRFRDVLVAGQIALSAVLLIGAGLFLQSLRAAQSIDPGFEPDNVLLASVDPSLQGYDAAQARSFYERLAGAVEGLPGVRSVALAESLPMEMGGNQWGVSVPGYVPAPNERMNVDYNTVTPGYFETMRIPLLAGRDFGPEDRAEGQGALIVNETMANRFWPSSDAIGKRIETGGMERIVVGVVGDTKVRSLGERPLAFMSFPYEQTSHGAPLTLHAKTEREPLQLADAVRAEVRALDASLPVYDVQTMHERLGLALLPSRLSAGVFGAFGSLALLMAAIGLYGVMAHTVSQKTREIGLRMALGAGAREVFGLVLRRAAILSFAGMAFGLLAGLVVNRSASHLLYGTSASDPLIYTVAASVILVVVFAASAVPARRAVQIDPMSALRHE